MAQTTPELAKKTPYYTAWDDPAKDEPYRNAATTPYVFPSGCPPQGTVRDMTIHRYEGEEDDEHWKLVINDLRWVVPWEFATCLPMEPIETLYYWDPSGTMPRPTYYDWMSTKRSATYSPGVCPTGWDALNMGVSTYSRGKYNDNGGPDGYTVSTATCCKRGDSIGTHAWAFGGPAFDYCAQKMPDSSHHESLDITMTEVARIHYTTIWNGTFTSILKITDNVWTSTTITGMITRSEVEFSTYTSTHTWTTGSFWYPAWSIIWDNSDTATMSPKPPVLTNGMLIPTWTDGMVLEDGKYGNGGKGPSETTVTDMVPTTETVTATLATATVVSMHYVQTAGPGGMDEEEMMRSGLLPPKNEDKTKEVDSSAQVGGEATGATNEVDGMVVAVRLLLMFLWLSFMAGGARMFWLKRRRRASKGGIELEERIGRGPRYTEVARQEEGEIQK